MFWLLVDRYDRAITSIGLLLPFLGLAFGLWRHRRFREQDDLSSASGNAGMGCLGGTALGFVVLVFTTCVGPFGVGDRAVQGRQRAYVIMSALGRYQTTHGALPDSLPTLVPEYLNAAALVGPPYGKSVGHPFEYERHDSTYVLTFKYFRPGMNYCSIASVARTWTCGRYF